MDIVVMIAEDEVMARKELLYLLEKERNIIITPSAENGHQLVDMYPVYKPDVIFMDVEMPGHTGIEAARLIKKQYGNPLFVFTTAYDEYALEAFDVAAIDYLLKPYNEDRLHETINRIRKQLAKSMQREKESESSVGKILIDDGERMIVVSPDTIYYAVPHNRLLEIYTEERVITTRMTLQELETQLNHSSFFRAHRSYLVNLNHVLEITPWFNGTSNITMNNPQRTKIPVSRSASKIIYSLFK